MAAVSHKELNSFGEVTVYYRDDDNDSGYGDNAQCAYWWNDSNPPAADDPRLQWETPPLSHAPDEFDLACERRHD